MQGPGSDDSSMERVTSLICLSLDVSFDNKFAVVHDLSFESGQPKK